MKNSLNRIIPNDMKAYKGMNQIFKQKNRKLVAETLTKNEKKQVDSLIDSIEVLSNPNTMKQLADSAKDIKAGKVQEINSVKDLM